MTATALDQELNFSNYLINSTMEHEANKKKKASRACLHCQRVNIQNSLRNSIIKQYRFVGTFNVWWLYVLERKYNRRIQTVFHLARPCQRCVKRDLASTCTDAARKRAKYLQDIPADECNHMKKKRDERPLYWFIFCLVFSSSSVTSATPTQASIQDPPQHYSNDDPIGMTKRRGQWMTFPFMYYWCVHIYIYIYII